MCKLRYCKQIGNEFKIGLDPRPPGPTAANKVNSFAIRLNVKAPDERDTNLSSSTQRKNVSVFPPCLAMGIYLRKQSAKLYQTKPRQILEVIRKICFPAFWAVLGLIP